MTARTLPSADDLTHAQHQGWACVWCSTSLWTDRGGISVGRAQSTDGSSIEVYACPDPCGCGPSAPARSEPREHTGAGGLHKPLPRTPATNGPTHR